MAERQLKLYAETTHGGTRPVTTTINNVNTDATSADMTAFGKMLNRFTSNEYKKTDLVETTNVDTETIPVPKTQTTIQMKVDNQVVTSIPIGTLRNDVFFSAVTNSDSQDLYFSIEAPSGKNSGVISLSFFGNDISIQANNQTTAGCILRFMLPETETYTAAVTTVTITE